MKIKIKGKMQLEGKNKKRERINDAREKKKNYCNIERMNRGTNECREKKKKEVNPAKNPGHKILVWKGRSEKQDEIGGTAKTKTGEIFTNDSDGPLLVKLAYC